MRESRETRKKRAGRIVRALGRAYPDARIALRFRNAYELLVATILSAQCTDTKVNEVTETLFARYPTAGALAEAEPGEVERIVHATGFFRQKAKSIQSAARDLVEQHGGEVPGEMEALVALRGVARKTANVVLGNAFDVPGLAIDTHMKRVHARLGLSTADDPVEIETDLMALIPRPRWTRYTHQVIHHGRVCCDARRPRCDECPLSKLCPWPRSTEGRKKLK